MLHPMPSTPNPMKPLSAIVLCAGQGKRMNSAQPKVLHPILGRPLAYYPLRRAFEVGATSVVAVVGHQAATVEARLREIFADQPLRFALQEQQRGTAHAVRAAEGALAGFSGDVLILYGDVPLVRRELLQQLLETHRQGPGPLTLVTFRPENPFGYGRLLRSGGRVLRVVEEKDATPDQRAITECNAGIYVADASFLWEALRGIGANNAQGEFYLTDLVAAAAQAGAPIATVEAQPGEVAGVNDRRELAQVSRVLQQRINTQHQLAGVTLLDPATAYIDETVQLATDVELGPQVMISGATRVGSGTRIGVGCVITDSVVGEGVELKPYSVLEKARVGARCLIGPFARLRPETDLAEGVHLGNFVETKKARIGRGSKANHLTYLGDAEIGAGVNVGAGTITCNYDGVDKHQTRLGDGVFVGSDTQFVAPVSVGEGAYIGAGSTIVRDVPSNALALSRPQQVIKEGWAAQLRAQREKKK
jgi:bifunctional UDP-N-acetylglucosamine pyrophosphorylase/glucosamine-1-phosphate N-acetyltransferase